MRNKFLMDVIFKHIHAFYDLTGGGMSSVNLSCYDNIGQLSHSLLDLLLDRFALGGELNNTTVKVLFV